jgi:molybdate transport system permease protein
MKNAPKRVSRIASWAGFSLFLALATIATLLLSLPVVALVWRSFQDKAWAVELDPRVWQAISLSFRTTFVSIIIIVVVGTPLAYILARWQFRGKRIINALVELPIVMPPAVAGLGLLMAFGRRGLFGKFLFEELGIRLVFSPAAVVMAQTFVAMPFFLRAAQLGFQQVDREIENAALVDGANAVTCFLYVTYPLARRSLLAGLLMSWARALGEFGATILFAGSLPGRTQTMTLLIYSMFEQNISAAIWTGLLLIGVAVVVIVITQFLVNPSRDTDD